MEQLQTARAEKKRQESSLEEKERDKESQRVAFLKTQREQREKGLTEQNQSIDNHEKKRLVSTWSMNKVDCGFFLCVARKSTLGQGKGDTVAM